jgi:predicted AAA+ superfamily ATPase
MVMANSERMQRALDVFRDGLLPPCEQTFVGFFGDDWLEQVNQKSHHPEPNPSKTDVSFLLKSMKVTWGEVWGAGFSPTIRSLVFEVADARNRWAHQDPMSSDDVSRALDSMERVLEALGNVDERKELRDLRKDLARQIFEEESRSERRKTAAKPTQGQPLAGLTPWRDVINPHQDVASGRFEQAEFAADLHEVAAGTADTEYQDPKAFYARTFLTEGLTDLLVGAARRLSSGGGDPIIELQTNFGGGKTHSMIALYHLASGVPAKELPGLDEAFSEAGVSLPPSIRRAAIACQVLSPAAIEEVEPGVQLHTIWGRLAYQLGGKEGYEFVRTDDEAGTNPGSALKKLFEWAGPSVILLDEWVSYARQLNDAGSAIRLAGGDFETQFTFAQALTEMAAAVDNVVVLVSIPESAIEVGGPRGQQAMEMLKNVVTRKAKQWQPASPDESFEIVRRRLFDPVSVDQARVRDGVIRAFAEMYRTQLGDFPSAAAEDAYRKRMEQSYPIHPELFDRLFGEWSTLDKFQRTRGVLRLMAIAISKLWIRGDRSLLIMPGTLPIDDSEFASELSKYLEPGWESVIKSDVDGPNALPLRLDSDPKHPHFGRISATRRAARTVYMGSAARPDGSRGLDIKSVVLGCVQPGESPGMFADALKRLSREATHLYPDGQQYWYSLQPNATRLAADRAASTYSDRDADDEVSARISKHQRAPFEAMQVFAEGPGDVPDDDTGARLVVLSPNFTHSANDANSQAIDLATTILAQRDGGPRVNKNLLVFVAAAANRLGELRGETRLHLAWKSIAEDHESLQLTPAQKKQAEDKITETSKAVDSLIGEAFTLVMTPKQTPGTPDIEWQTTKASPTGPLPERVAKKLATEEKLIEQYGGVRVKMDIDQHNLWSERGDITVRELWARYASLPYLPRLASAKALDLAISNGTNNINWANETFGYAEAHDGSKYVGVLVGEMVSPTPSGLVLRPDVVPLEEDEVSTPDSDEEADDETGATGGSGGRTGPGTPEPTKPGSFYAVFDLDRLRGATQMSDIIDHITAHLGDNISLTVEVRADSPTGFDDSTRRTVSENAANLNATAAEFE